MIVHRPGLEKKTSSRIQCSSRAEQNSRHTIFWTSLALLKIQVFWNQARLVNIPGPVQLPLPRAPLFWKAVMHDNPNSSNKPLLSTNISCQSRYQYAIFANKSMLVLRWYSLVKNIAIVVYLLFMMLRDLTLLQYKCVTSIPLSKELHFKLSCRSLICLWLHRISGVLPWFVVKSIPSVCLYFLIIGVMSGCMMVYAIRNRECAESPDRRFIRVLAALLSVVFQVFVMFFVYYAIFISVEWRVSPIRGTPITFVLQAVGFAFTLSVLLLVEFVVYVRYLFYVCSSRESRNLKYESVDGCSPTQPTADLHEKKSVEMLLKPQAEIVANSAYFLDSNANKSNGRLEESLNATAESCGYLLRRRMDVDGQEPSTSFPCLNDRPSGSIDPNLSTGNSYYSKGDYDQIADRISHNLLKLNHSAGSLSHDVLPHPPTRPLPQLPYRGSGSRIIAPSFSGKPSNVLRSPPRTVSQDLLTSSPPRKATANFTPPDYVELV